MDSHADRGLTLVEVLLLVLVLAGYLLAITGTLNKIASTAAPDPDRRARDRRPGAADRV